MNNLGSLLSKSHWGDGFKFKYLNNVVTYCVLKSLVYSYNYI